MAASRRCRPRCGRAHCCAISAPCSDDSLREREAWSMAISRKGGYGFSMTRAALFVLFLNSALAFAPQAHAGDGGRHASVSGSPQGQEQKTAAAEADAWFENYRFAMARRFPGC